MYTIREEINKHCVGEGREGSKTKPTTLLAMYHCGEGCLLEMEEKGSSEESRKLLDEISKLQNEILELKNKDSDKDKEVTELQTKIKEFNMQDIDSLTLQKRVQSLEEENLDLSTKVQDLQRLLHESRNSHDQENNDLIKLQNKMGSKVTELYELHEQIISTIKKESNS
ncbi:hypothetical protein LOTGIDRAFT_235033 [Lottia gigantea]|uniref:Uncharacterized protein n=1 Tax=Lottia gigantea TaxID=225164 RepID=V3ZT75_LOTGI|nr:hypothetical protein LOTGIDRAFT_235033 [Lottia gigantea]ESO87562.1 hypothetical protein LOTGIDRAFT_235033 [Lottia gigantea]